jgi:hypothetical protein
MRFRRADQAYSQRIAGLTFFDDTRFGGLQAADMVAYWERQRRAGRINQLDEILSWEREERFTGTISVPREEPPR